MKDNESKSKKGLRKNKYSHLYKTRKLTPEEYKDYILFSYFTDDEDGILPIDVKVIEEKFDKFFTTLIDLVENKDKDGLINLKEALKIIFYEDLSLRTQNDTYLKNLFKDTKNIKIALDKFESVVRDAFIIPNFLVNILRVKSTQWLEAYMKLGRERNLRVNAQATYKNCQSEKNSFIKKIKVIKFKLAQKNPGKRISISAIARELGKPRSTFDDELKKFKINISEI